jgi:hypothetical protein
VAKAKGRLRGSSPLNVRQEAHLVALRWAGEHSVAELGQLFGVARSTSTAPSSGTQRASAPRSPVVRHWEALCRRRSRS